MTGIFRGGRARRSPAATLVALTVTLLTASAHAAGTISFADPVVEVAEGGSKAVLIVRTGDASGAATVVLTANPGPATLGTDFDIDLPTGTVEFPADVTFRRVTVTGLVDTEAEGVENAHLVLSSPSGAALGSQNQLLLLIHDVVASGDPYVSFAATGTSRIEDTIYRSRLDTTGEGNRATLTIVRSPAADAGTVDLTVVGGTATVGVDFSDPTATLAFAAGTASVDVELATLDDAEREGVETVELLLAHPSPPGTVLRSALATVLIDDNENGQAGQLALHATSGAGSPLQVMENAGSVQFRVERTAGTTGPVTVDYAAIGTSMGGAVAGEDFVAATGTLAFADGASTATFSIPVLDDSSVNILIGDFRVILANPTGGATIDPAASSVTVALSDNEPLDLCGDGTNDCLGADRRAAASSRRQPTARIWIRTWPHCGSFATAICKPTRRVVRSCGAITGGRHRSQPG